MAGLWPSDIIGGVFWAVGFTIETTADFQKYAFKQNPANKGRFINTGTSFPPLIHLVCFPNVFALLHTARWVRLCSGVFLLCGKALPLFEQGCGSMRAILIMAGRCWCGGACGCLASPCWTAATGSAL